MNLDVIRTLTIRSRTEGVEESTDQLNKLSGAHDNIADSSKNATGASLTYEQALARQQRALAQAYQTAKQFEQTKLFETNDRAQILAYSDALDRLGLSTHGAVKDIHELNASSAHLAAFLREPISAAETGISAFIRWGRVLGATGLVAAAAGVGYLAMTGNMKALSDVGATVSDKMGSLATSFGNLDGKTVAAVGVLGLAAAALALFHTEAHEAEHGSDSLVASSSKLGHSTGSLVAPMLAAGGAVGLLIAAYQLYSKVMGNMIDLVDRANDTRLGTNMLQGLDVAATAARVPIEKVTSAIDNFTKVSKGTEKENEKFYKSLSNINPAFTEAFKSAPTQIERLNIIADALSTAKNETDKFNLSQQAFATDNERTISIFDKGRAGLDAHISKLRELGIVIDEEFIKKAADAQAKMAAFATLGIQRASIAVVDLSKAISDLVNTHGGLESILPANAITSFTSFNQVVRDLGYTLSLLAQAWQAFYSQIGTKNPDLSKVLDPLMEIFSSSADAVTRRAFAVAGGDFGTEFANKFTEATADIFNHLATTADPSQAQAQFATVGSILGQTSGTKFVEVWADIMGRLGASADVAKAAPEFDSAGRMLGGVFGNAFVEVFAGIYIGGISKVATDAIGRINKFDQALRNEPAKGPAFQAQGFDKQTAAMGGTIDAYERMIQATEDHTEEMTKEMATLGLSKEAVYTLKIQHDLLRAAKKSGVDITAKEIARIDEVAAAYGRTKAQLEQYKAIHASIVNLGSSFLSGFAKDIANGVKPMEALASAAKKLLESLIDIAAKAVVTNLVGGMFGGASGAGASLIAAATTASGITAAGGVTGGAALATGGGVAGTETAAGGVTGGAALAAGGTAAGFAMWGPIALLIAAVAALSFFGGKNDDKLDRAKATWEAMRKDIERFVDKLSGNTGSVKAAWQDIQDQIDKYQQAAGDAEDWAGRDKIGNDLQKFQLKIAKEFTDALSAVLQSWNDGFGADSDFIKGMENVKRVAEEVAKVLADIKFVYGGTDDENSAGYTDKLTEATKAATTYLLSLITGTDELSEITKKLQDMSGAAYQLQTELEKLGYTSEQAAALIADAFTKAINKLIAKFYDDVERKINSQGGKDYLNKIKDLIDEVMTMITDALELGITDLTSIINYYLTEIQKIVDSSSEVTQAKQDLIDAYNKEKDAIEGSIAAINSEIDALKSLRETILSMIDDITTSGMNAIERLITMQARFRSWQDVMADPSTGKSEDFTKYVESAKAYLEAIKEVIELVEQLIQSFISIKQTIRDIIDTIADSGLSSEEKLAQSRDKFLQAWGKMLLEMVTQDATGGNVDPKFYEDIAKYGQEFLDAIDDVISGLEQRIAKLQGAREAILAYIDQLQLEKLDPTQLAEEMRRRFQETYTKAMSGDEDAMVKLTEDARNYIDALKAQGDALQQTSDKLAGFIDAIKAFRESLKTDPRLSILSPGDQLAAAKAEFDRLTVLAQGGDLDAAAKLSDAARKYLDLAKAYFASSEAYAEIYRQVDAILKQTEESLSEQKSIADQQLEVIKEQLGAINEVIEALKLAADKAATMIDYLKAQIDELEKLKDLIADILETVVDLIDIQISVAEAQLDALEKLKDEVVDGLNRVVSAIDTVITWQTIQVQLLTWQLAVLTSYVSQYVDINNNVKSVTQAVVDLKTITFNILTEILNEITKNGGAQSGGLIGMATGGIVSGGTYNVDSVRARFAGGGNIMLAGGEYVTTAPSVNASTIGMLEHINRTGSVANDNGQHFEQLARTIVRVASATTTAEIESNREEMRMLRAEVRNLGNRNTARERGTKVASG